MNAWILTILTAVIIFVLGQIILKFIIEPLHEQWKVIAEIADALIYYANAFPTDQESEKAKEAHDTYRQLATKLQAKTKMIPLYSFLQRLNLVIDRSLITKAVRELIGLSNEVYFPHMANPDIRSSQFRSVSKRREDLNQFLDLGLDD